MKRVTNILMMSVKRFDGVSMGYGLMAQKKSACSKTDAITYFCGTGSSTR